MEAAVRLAEKNGFSGTRVSDIVGVVGVGQGVFYWYFESKDALFREILADSRRRLRHYQGAFIENESDPVRRIALGIVASIEFYASNRHVFAFMEHAARAGFRGDLRARRVHVADTSRHVQQAMDSGLIPRSDATLLAHGVSVVVERMAAAALVTGRADVERIAQVAVDFALGGLVGSAGVTVADLRAGVDVTPALLDVRDRIGALGPEPERPAPETNGSPNGPAGSS